MVPWVHVTHAPQDSTDTSWALEQQLGAWLLLRLDTDTLTLEGANGSAFVDAAASIRVSGVVTLTFTYEPVLSQPSPPSTSASSRSQGTLALGYSGALSGHVAGNSGPDGAVTARDSLAQDFSHKTGGETKAAPLLAYMKELSRRELAGVDGGFARLMTRPALA